MKRRTKLAIERDKKIKALHAGKRVSADGNIYYEYRTEHSDANRTKRLAKGGNVGELTFEEAEEKFKNSYVVSVPYKYWNYERPENRIKKHLKSESNSVGKDLISATWSTNGEMTIISSDSSYVVNNVSEKQYDKFWQEREFNEDEEYANGGEISEDRINEVLEHYMIAALWSSTDMDTDEPLDANYSIDDIAPDTKIQMYKDVKMFIEDNYDAIQESGSTDEQLGHDLWLSRNGHGAGFFDRGYGEVGDKLQEAAGEMKSVDLYVGDDGMIHQLGVFKKGGRIKSNNWIKGALSGGKNKGALRRTAMRKGLLRNEDENLSMTDLHKLEKMGGKTAKRAHLAETLRSFADGGELTDKEQELKSKIEAILEKVVPNFYHKVWIYRTPFGTGKNLGILIAASDKTLNEVRGQYPQVVSLTLDLNSLSLHPQIFGGNGGQSIYRKPNMEDPKEKYLAMKSVKIPFRTPPKEEGAVLKAIEKFAENYKKTLKENIDVLKYTDIVDYDALLSSNKMAEGGELADFEQKLKEAFKQPNKWHFLTGTINGHTVQMKFYVGVKEVDVQIFKKDNLHVSLGKNYAGKRETMKMIMDALSSKFENGGGVESSKHLHTGRYISLDITPNGNLKITLDEDGREEVLEMRDDDRNDDYIMDELFDDIRGNSELMFHSDAGESGFGMTNAPAITDGYYHDDNGDLTDEGHEDSEVYYFERYMIDSFIDKMLEDGYVIFDRAIKSKKMAKGGRVTKNEDVLERFLDSNEEVHVKNLSTHYNEYDKEVLLRNYATLIAIRKGENVKITSKKYSQTTSTIQNKLRKMAEERGFNIIDIEEFEDGGMLGGSELKALESSLRNSLSSGKEISQKDLENYLGRNAEYEEDVVGYNIRRCFMKPFYKKIK